MKKFVKAALIVVAVLAVIPTLVLVQKVDPAQQPADIVPYDFPDTLANYDYDLDSIKALIGPNKGLPPGYELAAAIAFSAYPELKDLKIDMELVPDGAPMESTMNPWSILGPRKKRQYKILLVEVEGSRMDPILMHSLPFDAQVGILAHELGHTVYYHKLGMWKMGKWGWKYLSDPEFRATHERTTDLMPIYHGLGSQIYQYAHFVRYDTSTVAFYERGKWFMDTFYMTDSEVMAAWESFENGDKTAGLVR